MGPLDDVEFFFSSTRGKKSIKNSTLHVEMNQMMAYLVLTCCSEKTTWALRG